jgi:hypothetical protein
METVKKVNYIDNSILDKMNSINEIREKINVNAEYSDFQELRDLLMDISLYFDEKFVKMEELLNKIEKSHKYN